MYGFVLLAALSAGEGSPAWGYGWTGGYGAHAGYAGYDGGYGLGPWCRWGAQYGSCYGMGYGGWGLPYGGYGPGFGPGWPGYACFGGCGGYSSPAYGVPGPLQMNVPAAEEGKGTKEITPRGKEVEGEVSADRARIIINLPRDAKLFVEDRQIKGAAQKKEFLTPTLEKDQYYYYEFRAEVVRDGKPVSETRRLMLKAGGTFRADFSSLGTTGVASAPSH
jgi:uncharacterized protein (TIGR03000 family)